jgi:hypothetical protein
MYIYIYIYISIHTHTFTLTHTYIYIYIYIHTRRYNDDVVEAMLQEAEKNKKRPVNVALNKMQLQEEKELAWEEYKTTQDEEEKNVA